jgi:PAS domain S-box-containing protein
MRFIRSRTSSKFLSGLSLQRRIIIGSTAAVIIPFLIMAIFLYQRLSRELVDQSREKSVQIAKDLSALVDTSLKMELKVISAIAADTQIADALHAHNYEAIHAKLALVFSKIGSNYISIFITDRSGIIRVDLPEAARKGLDVSDREYFIKAKQGTAGVTGPILTRGPASSIWTNKPILITTAPITRNGVFIGAIGITHDIDAIRSIMSGIRLGKTGYPFVTDRNGLVIIHPNHDYVMKVNMFKETGMERILEKIRHREIGAERYNFRGTEKIAGFAPLNITGWNIIFTQNRNEIMEPVNDTLLSIAIIGISFIIIVILSIILLSKKISSPVQKFVDILQKFTTHTNEFIIGIGSDRKIMFANPAAEQFTGKSAEELIGSDPDFTNTQNIPPEVIWKKIESGTTWLGRITPKTEIDNGPVIAIMIIPVKDERGNISGYLEFGRDISGELIQEKRIQQAQKIEAIGTLAGGIAHDFNNILTGMYGYIELALLNPDNPAKTEQYLGELQKAATRASDLVNQILTFSRHSKPELQTILPKTIVKEVIKLIRASTPAEIIIEANLESETSVMADPIQIHQVIVNLCTNAVHAIGEKHGTIRIDLEDIIIDQKFTDSHPGLGTGKHVLFRITDTGDGILPDVIDHIFEPFFTTKENGGGTGLGLSVAYGIIHNLGGIITVYSEPGKGSVFNIFIPAALHDADNAVSDRSGLMHGTERIMLIDDESAIVSPVSSILASIGYQVSPFTESMPAIETLRKNPDAFDIVITDHSMPEFTGIDIAVELKQLKRSLPVILMSGFVNRQMEEHAAKCGIDAIVKKPVSMSVLTGVIRKILDKQD